MSNQMTMLIYFVVHYSVPPFHVCTLTVCALSHGFFCLEQRFHGSSHCIFFSSHSNFPWLIFTLLLGYLDQYFYIHFAWTHFQFHILNWQVRQRLCRPNLQQTGTYISQSDCAILYSQLYHMKVLISNFSLYETETISSER